MIRVFGITGTNGKTTASWMLRNILKQTAPCGLVGTIEYITGKNGHMPKNTTPGKELLMSLLEEMKAAGMYQCVMEVSSHGIDQGRIDGINFSVTGFTNLSRDHLDYHGTMEQYFQTKKKLFMETDADCVINIGDRYGRRLYSELLQVRDKGSVKSCSVKIEDADIYGKAVSRGVSGTGLELYCSGLLLGNMDVNIPGEHFAEDALLASAMALQSGCSFDVIKKGIEATTSVPGRMECTGSAEDTLGVVDYAHTPDSLEKLLKTLKRVCRGKLICVFGCGGFRDKGKRRMMGETAGKICDYCIITNDNPRGEAPESIAQAIEEGVYSTGCGYSVILDRYQAIKRAVSLADKWDIIVVAGKGHETYQMSGDFCIPFNDKEVLKELLEKKYEKTYNETN